jgi:hypothetical protein
VEKLMTRGGLLIITEHGKMALSTWHTAQDIPKIIKKSFGFLAKNCYYYAFEKLVTRKDIERLFQHDACLVDRLDYPDQIAALLIATHPMLLTPSTVSKFNKSDNYYKYTLKAKCIDHWELWLDGKMVSKFNPFEEFIDYCVEQSKLVIPSEGRIYGNGV